MDSGVGALLTRCEHLSGLGQRAANRAGQRAVGYTSRISSTVDGGVIGERQIRLGHLGDLGRTLPDRPIKHAIA